MNTDAGATVTEVLPHEAYEILKEPNAVLVDVRTKSEWSFVGVPDLDALGKRVKRVEWLAFPEMTVNPEFTGELFSSFGDKFPEKLLFICRSGVRSLDAADYVSEIVEEIGRNTRCINVSEGFEGDLDENKHRGNVNGWKMRKLPWRQT